MTNNNESLGLAGWLFADLLLGLVVIFLAIGYVSPGDDSSEAAPTTTTSTTTTTTITPTTTTTTTTTTTLCPGIESPGEGLKQVGIEIDWAYNDKDQFRRVVGEFLNKGIEARLAKKGLAQIESEKIGVGYVLAWAGAGGNPSRAEEQAARDRAVAFIRQLGVVMPDRFKEFEEGEIKGRPGWARWSKSLIEVWYFPKLPSTDC